MEGIFGVSVTCICITRYMVMGMIAIYLLCQAAWLHGGVMNSSLGCRGLMAFIAAVHSGLVRLHGILVGSKLQHQILQVLVMHRYGISWVWEVLAHIVLGHRGWFVIPQVWG